MSNNHCQEKKYFLSGFLDSISISNFFVTSNLFSLIFLYYLENEELHLENCGICLSPPINPFRPINCIHYFCRCCIKKWYEQGKNCCPICRKNFSMIPPLNIIEMKNTITFTSYYKQKLYHLKRKISKDPLNKFCCDICQIKSSENDLLSCIICEIFFIHYYCDTSLYICDNGYICPNCRYIFSLEL